VINFRGTGEVLDGAEVTTIEPGVTVDDRGVEVVDDRGHEVVDWENAPTVREPMRVQPTSSNEETVNADTIVSLYRATLGPYTTANSRSRIRYDGMLFTVEGDVQQVRDSRDRLHHHTAVLRRVESE
jgi:hypothetical protein